MKGIHRFSILAVGLFVVLFGLLGGFGLESIPIAQAHLTSIGQWKTTGSMLETRAFFTATRLRNGRVLVSGGYSNTLQILATAGVV